MVEKIKKGAKIYFQCPKCSFFYKNKNFAEECENWCKKHKSCNTEITQYSVELIK